VKKCPTAKTLSDLAKKFENIGSIAVSVGRNRIRNIRTIEKITHLKEDVKHYPYVAIGYKEDISMENYEG